MEPRRPSCLREAACSLIDHGMLSRPACFFFVAYWDAILSRLFLSPVSWPTFATS